MAATVEIRRVRAGDAGLLERVAEDVFDRDIVPARLEASLAAQSHLMVLAISDGVVVGQARGVIHKHVDEPDTLFVDNLGVTPALHRQGLGRRLMVELIAWGRERGCHEAWVATEIDNHAARGLYEALGSEGAEMVYYEYRLRPAPDQPSGGLPSKAD